MAYQVAWEEADYGVQRGGHRKKNKNEEPASDNAEIVRIAEGVNMIGMLARVGATDGIIWGENSSG